MTLAAPAPGDEPHEGGRGRGGISTRARALLDAVAPLSARAVVCYSSGRHFLTEADPVWWLTRHRPLGETVAAIGPDGAVDLFVAPDFDVARAKERARGARVRAGGVGELGRWQRALGAAVAVAVWGRHKLVGRSADALAAALGGVVDADAVCEGVSRRRSSDDVHVLEQACRIADEGHRAMLDAARPGMAEFEVASEVLARMRDVGAGDTFLLLSSSRHNLALHPPTERRLAEGDVLLAELSPSVDGMYTQLCRTAVVGAASAQLRADYAILAESLAAGAGACLPGATCAEAVAAMDAVIADAGYGEYCRPPHMRARGHGLGLASSMPGDVTRDNERRLVEGDVFVLHPNQYLPVSGYLLCGEPVLVTAEGGRPLTGTFAPLSEVVW
jgi:Xaa-Pro dipeptidase